MIVSDLYTADLTINSSPTQTIFTKMIPSIPIENEEFSGAYWLGWIKIQTYREILNVVSSL